MPKNTKNNAPLTADVGSPIRGVTVVTDRTVRPLWSDKSERAKAVAVIIAIIGGEHAALMHKSTGGAMPLASVLTMAREDTRMGAFPGWVDADSTRQRRAIRDLLSTAVDVDASAVWVEVTKANGKTTRWVAPVGAVTKSGKNKGKVTGPAGFIAPTFNPYAAYATTEYRQAQGKRSRAIDAVRNPPTAEDIAKAKARAKATTKTMVKATMEAVAKSKAKAAPKATKAKAKAKPTKAPHATSVTKARTKADPAVTTVKAPKAPTMPALNPVT